MNNRNSFRAYVKFGLLLLLVFGGSLGTFFGVNTWLKHKYSAVLLIQVAPSGSKISLDNKTVKEGELHVQPGKHTVKVERSGFATITKKVTLKKDFRTLVPVALVPNSDSTRTWYDTHADDSKKAEAISSKSHDQYVQTVLEKYPLISQLPYYGEMFEFEVHYTNDPLDPANKIIIYVYTNTDIGRQHALDWIRSRGYDPADYRIIFATKSVGY